MSTGLSLRFVPQRYYINIVYDISTEMVKNDQTFYRDGTHATSCDYWDYDNIEFEIFDENGQYSNAFIDFLQDDYGEQYFFPPDLSLIGSSLKVIG